MKLSAQRRQEKRNNFLIILSQSLQFTRIVFEPELVQFAVGNIMNPLKLLKTEF